MSALCRGVAVLAVFFVALAACAAEEEKSVKTDPPADAELSRPPQSVRVWLPFAPDVAQCSLTIKRVGDSDEAAPPLEIQGLHTMGYDDLMGRVVGRVSDGDYELHWTAVGVNGETLDGSSRFSLKRGS